MVKHEFNMSLKEPFAFYVWDMIIALICERFTCNFWKCNRKHNQHFTRVNEPILWFIF